MSITLEHMMHDDIQKLKALLAQKEKELAGYKVSHRAILLDSDMVHDQLKNLQATLAQKDEEIARLYRIRELKEVEHLNALLQGERECWRKAEDAARKTAFLMGNDMWKERKALNDHADWCRDQLKEVE